jgi:hypothetical protein
MRRSRETTGEAIPRWPSGRDRPRVLVENPDFGVGYAVEHVLRDDGYDVALCGGPDRLPHHECPLIFEGRCGAVEGADVVVHSLNPDRPDHASVLRGLRSRYPDVPVVVEVPGPTAARHPGLLHGCVVLASPAKRETLVAAVRQALEAS